METSQMGTPSDLKTMTQYKKFTLRNHYYASRETQQIYMSYLFHAQHHLDLYIFQSNELPNDMVYEML